jgi:2-polyprenyl-3-methyl-5-hydroxy-6-metoxy-1,4-benzoquinol methylase
MLKKNRGNFLSQLQLPFSETPFDLLEKIFHILQVNYGLTRNSNQNLIDLGAGNGQIIIYSALNYGIKSFGIEINENLIIEARQKVKILKTEKKYKKKLFRKIKLINQDFFNISLKKYDFIYIFTLPTMQKFLNHLFLTAKTGAIVISFKYPLNNFEKILKLSYKLELKDIQQDINTFYYVKL